jgi:hypothetical protein
MLLPQRVGERGLNPIGPFIRILDRRILGTE